MKSFKNFLEFKESHSDTPALYRIINIAWNKYPDETSSFIKKLAAYDQEIANEFSRVKPNFSVSKNIDPEDIIRPEADKAGDQG